DSDVAASVECARGRNRGRDRSESDEGRFETENREFLTRVRNTDLEIANRQPERVMVVDARRAAAKTHAKIWQVVLTTLATGARSVCGRLRLPDARQVYAEHVLSWRREEFRSYFWDRVFSEESRHTELRCRSRYLRAIR